MNEKIKKQVNVIGNTKNFSISNQVNDKINSIKKKPFEVNQQPESERNTIKNKRSLSHLENIKPFLFKSCENNSFNKTSSRKSLNYNPSFDRDFQDDNFNNTFRNMFSHFNKLTEIMSNNNQMNSHSFRQKSRKMSKSKISTSGIKRVDTYEPLSDSQKMRYIEEISRGSEQRMRAYNSIFNTIKNQISTISYQEEEDEIENNLLNSLKRNNNNLIIENISKTIENNTRDFNDKNFNIINNNITVNIISNNPNTAEIEGINNIYPKGIKEKSNPRLSKGSSTFNASLTLNEDIEEENKNFDKNLVVPSNSFKNKTDLEFQSPHNFNKLKYSKNNSNHDLNCDDLDKLNKNLELRSTFLIAKSELIKNRQHRASMSDIPTKDFCSPRDNYPVTSSFNGDLDESELNRNEDNTLEKKKCIIY